VEFPITSRRYTMPAFVLPTNSERPTLALPSGAQSEGRGKQELAVTGV